MKINEHLHAFFWRSMSANNCNTYLIDGPARVLIDPGHLALFDHVRDGLSGLGLAPADMDLVVSVAKALPRIKLIVGIQVLTYHYADTGFSRKISQSPHVGNLHPPDQVLLGKGVGIALAFPEGPHEVLVVHVEGAFDVVKIAQEREVEVFMHFFVSSQFPQAAFSNLRPCIPDVQWDAVMT